MAAICFVMECGLEYNTHVSTGKTDLSSMRLVWLIQNAGWTVNQRTLKMLAESLPLFRLFRKDQSDSAHRVIIGQWNIKISKESNYNKYFVPFSSFSCGDLHLYGKPALDNWKIVSRASLFKLVWKGVKSRLWSFVWSWLVMFWRFWRESLF